jgi:hypothetical protein
MALASLFNTPSDENEFNMWSFANQDQHRLIVNAIFNQKKVSINLYPLDPIPFNDVVGWLEIHQDQHAAENAILGIQLFDFTDVDFRNPAQLASWVRLHGANHQQAATILGIV